MIRVEHLYKSFNRQEVLKDINVDIAEGELLVILGESGSGKSVLLKNMIGLFKPDQGCVRINGEDITRMSERQLLGVRKKIGYLFQEGALYDFMNCYDNIAFPLREHTDFKEKVIREKIERILKLIDLEDVENKFPSELSGGMKKRVALARAICLDSKILFCDEPTSGLDPIRSRDISDLIRNVSKKLGCTTVVTSHDLPNSFRIADRCLILRNGAVVATGTPKEIQESDNATVREFTLN